jgi:hypothetical protein
MAEKEPNVLAVSASADHAVAEPTAIDADELERAGLDQRWRKFCLNAEQYVAETIRAKPR